MYRSSVKLNKLISRIIDFRKMDSDKMQLALQRINVVDFCQNLIEDYVSLCEQKESSFKFLSDHPDIQLTFDAEKLEMIISNLVSNAFKYTNKANNYTKEEQIFLLRCREIIDDNLNNDDFSIDFLADKLAMSHSSLYKKVKQMIGMCLIEFINDYKIYKAVQMFKHGSTNIETVSEKCGFKDIKNFREMFKRKMNMTPKAFTQSL